METDIAKVKSELKKRKLEDLKEKISKYSTVDPNKAQELLVEYQSIVREIGGKKNA